MEISGGDGRAGVSGTGRGFGAGCCLRLGSSFGSRFRRSGISDTDGASVVDGILCVVFVVLKLESSRQFHGGVTGIRQIGPNVRLALASK